MQELKIKIHGSGTTTLIILKEKINDIMKIIQALEDSNILLKGVTKTIFLGMLFRSQFIRKHVNRERNCKSRLWK